MLTLAPLPSTAPPLGTVCYGDHLDDRVLFAAPVGLALVPDRTDPGLLLVLYQVDASTTSDAPEVAGGWLRVLLAPRGPLASDLAGASAAGWTMSPFPVERVDYCLTRVLAAGTEELLTRWTEGDASDGVGTLTLDLTRHQAAVVAACLDAGDEVLSVRARLHFRALLPGLPALAVVEPTALLAWLRTVLGDGPVTADAVGAALLSLPESGGPVQLRPTTDAAAPAATTPGPDRPALLAALTAHLLDILTTADDSTDLRILRAAPDLPAEAATHLVVDLAVPRVAAQRRELDWSVSQAVREADAATREQMVVAVSPPQPFAAVDVRVASTLPAELTGLSQVKVELQLPGVTGLPIRRVLDVAGPGVQRFTTFYPALTTRWQLRYQLSALLGDTDRPEQPAQVWLGPRRAADTPMVRVDAAALGLTLARLTADPDVFARCEALEITLGASPPEATRTIVLTAQRRQHSVALRPADWQVSVLARGSGGTSAPLAPARPLAPDGVLAVHAADLIPRQPDLVRVVLAQPLDEAVVFALLTVAAPGMLERSAELRPGVATSLPVLRAGLLDPVRFRWQLRYVTAGADGRTRPMATTAWADADGPSLLLQLPSLAVPGPAAGQPEPAVPPEPARPTLPAGSTR